MDNKKLAQSAQTILKEQGHDISLGHVYELFSKLAGANSWNVAKAQNLMLAKVLDGPTREEPAEKAILDGGALFDVKIKAQYDGEVSKFYRVSADSEAQAREIIAEYLEYAHGNKDSDKEKPKFEQVALLVKEELDTAGFQYSNWEMIDSVGYEAEVTESYQVEQKEVEHIRRMQKYNDEFKNLNAAQVADKVVRKLT